MRRSETVLFTRREGNGHSNETVELANRAGLIRQFGSGLYGMTPTGQRVRTRLISHIKQEMDDIGGQLVSLPALNDSGIWHRSGRWGSFEGEMFTFENRDGKEMCLAPSHEEGIVHLVDGHVRSYEDLPLLLYQIEAKYRDDHARNGLLRMKEFTMKDAYSLHVSEDSLAQWYNRVRSAYHRIFRTLDLDYVVTEAENSVMGGRASEEFVALAQTGTMSVRYCTEQGCYFGVSDESPRSGLAADDSCPECGNLLAESEGIEIGHVFKLGRRYSRAMELTVDTREGHKTPVVMGSYGIGIDRLIHTILEQQRDEHGCRWPTTEHEAIAPFAASIIPLSYEGELRKVADRIYETLGARRTLLFDDPDQTIGERFAESDLLGLPWKIILGNHYLEEGTVEVESRAGDTQYVGISQLPSIMNELAIMPK